MPRHNRNAKGLDQLGNLWRISYQPDWMRLVKLSRERLGRRRSSRTLFKNPSRGAEVAPGRSIRTRIAAADGSVDVTVSLEDSKRIVDYIIVGVRDKDEALKFTIMGSLPRRK